MPDDALVGPLSEGNLADELRQLDAEKKP